jgi:protein O-mannosyl-transferase
VHRVSSFFATKKGLVAAFFSLIGCLFLAYIPAFTAPFIWDDEVMVVANPLIRSTDHIYTIFTTSAFGGAASANDFFRPVQTISYILDYQLFGMNPHGFHVMSWVYFALACLMFYFFLQLFFGTSPNKTDNQSLEKSIPTKVLLAIVLLFATHPLNIEVVTYISGRGDVLFLLFAFTALGGTLIAARNHTRGIVIAWTAALLAILSKENAVSVPFVMGLLWLILPRQHRRWRYWLAVIPPMVGTVTYIVYRMIAMADPTSAPLSSIAFASLGERVLTLPYILWTYFRLIFVPYPLHMEYLEVIRDIINPYLLLGIPIIIGTLFLLWKWGMPDNKNETDDTPVYSKKYGFLMAWVALGIGPVLQIVPLTATVREHWFSFSLAAALILIVSSLSKIIKPPYLYVLFAVTLISAMSLTYMRNLDWADPMRLYTHDANIEPRSFLLHNNIGVLAYRAGRLSDAKKAFQKSVLVTPNQEGYGTALNNLGVIAEHENNPQAALTYYQRSILASHYELAYANALRILTADQQWETAYNLAKEGLAKYPYHQDILKYAAITAFQRGYTNEGELLAKRLKQLYPE